MNKSLFDEVIGTPPASTVDVAGIIKHERRRTIASRTGGAMTFLVAAGLVGVFGAGQLASPGDQRVAEAPVASPGLQFRLVASDENSAAITAKQLTSALDMALRDAAPGARWIADSDTPPKVSAGDPPTVVGTPGSSARWFYGQTGVAAGTRRGSLTLQIIDPGLRKRAGKTMQERLLSCERRLAPDGGDSTCARRVTATGSRMAITTTTQPAPPRSDWRWSFRTSTVFVELPEDRLLELSSTNLLMAIPGAKSSPQQQDPPLTVDEVTEIAAEIAARIH